MSCYICDKPIDEPKLDPRDMKTCPCSECEAVIQDCIDTYPKGDNDEDSDDFVVYFEPEEKDFEEYFYHVRSASRDY